MISFKIENFFSDPDLTKKLLHDQVMEDHHGQDGVIYPGIVTLPDDVLVELVEKLDDLMDGKIKGMGKIFARYSLLDMKPPHWAHSDFEWGSNVCLINLSGPTSTHFVKHKDLGLEVHPRNDIEKKILLRDSNNKDKWEITDTVEYDFNTAHILDAQYLHAAGDSFGIDRFNGRLMLTAFFTV